MRKTTLNYLNLILWTSATVVGLILEYVSEEDSLRTSTALYSLSCIAGLMIYIRCKRMAQIERTIIYISLITLTAGYLFKYPIYAIYKQHNNNVIPPHLLSALFPEWTLQSSGEGIASAMGAVFAGYAGLLLATLGLQIKTNKSTKKPEAHNHIARNPPQSIALSAGLIIFSLTAILRLKFGLVMGAEPIGLPFGLGGILTIANSYLAPNLIIYSYLNNHIQGHISKARTQAIIAVIVGIIQYSLFYSKGAIFMPLFSILMSQVLLGALFSKPTQITVASILILAYPFLNIYRWIAMGGSVDIYAIQNAISSHSSEMEAENVFSLLIAGIFSIWGRVVGLDSLLTLIDASRSWNMGLFEYFFSDMDLDKHLTYQIIGFESDMGVSPGHLGRVFFISQSYLLTSASVFVMAYIPAKVLTVLYNSNKQELRPIAVVLLFYTLQLQISGFRIDVLTWWLFSTSIIMMLAIYAGKRSKRKERFRSTKAPRAKA